jgi:transcriptional regulator with XRE-family HTH domain
MSKKGVRASPPTVQQGRAAKGWTQEVLAERAGCSPRTIANLEAGKPVHGSILHAVADALGMAYSVLQAPTEADSSEAESASASPGLAPPLPSLLVGRTPTLRDLVSRLQNAVGRQQATPGQVLTVLCGWPGVGKTTLAAALAHDPEVDTRFPDGVLWAALGENPDLSLLLARWGRVLGNDDLWHAQTVEEASQRLSALLRTRRMLLILDDVWEAAHAAAFRVGGRQCATVITTRLTAVAQALAPTPGDVCPLPVLGEADALDLLKMLAPSVVQEYPHESQEIVRELGGLPLALQVAGRLLNAEAQCGWGISDLVRELREDTTRLLQAQAPPDRTDLAAQTTPTVAALLRKSTERLDPETRDRFAYLGAFAAKPATFGLDALAALWHVADPRPLVRTLLDRGLLEPIAGRFQMHPLLVAHARSLCAE